MIKVNHNINPDELVELVKKAETEGERIILEKEGKGNVVIINYADFKQLEAIEDAKDVKLLRQAMEESKGKPSVTFDELLDELDLTIEDLTSGNLDK